MAYLIQNKRKSTTIKCYIAAIRAVLRNGGIKLKEDKVLLASLTQACHLHYDRVRMHLSIRKTLLLVLLKSLDKFFNLPQVYLTGLYKALLCTAYYGLFRIGELTQSLHVVKAADVHVGENKNKLMFILHMSKTHSKGDKLQII